LVAIPDIHFALIAGKNTASVATTLNQQDVNVAEITANLRNA